MENLIILIIVVGAIYKIYKGYIEEQEKAKKRMEQIKRELQNKNPHQAPVPQIPIPQPVKTSSKPPLVTQKKAESFNDYPEFDEVEIARQRKIEQKRLEAERRLKQERQRTPTKQIQIEDLDEQHFDLRKAIIQQAVLERPYKD